MNQQIDPHTTTEETPHDPSNHRGHGWMMILCCVPMLVLAVVLVATGAIGFPFLVAALGCIAMMVVMMRLMR